MNHQKKLKQYQKKGLIQDLINKFSFLDGEKYFSSRIFQYYLVFIPKKNTLITLVTLLGLNHANEIEFQKKVLKTLLDNSAILHQLLLITIYYQK